MPSPVDGDLLLRLRAATREAAGVPWYDPSAASSSTSAFPPTLRAAAASLDLSTPTYLRCERCRCRLPRGLQSSICLFCGAQPRREFPATLAFTSTAAYRNLLASLDVDGTERVTLNPGSKNSNKSKDVSGEEVVLSSLFEYELKWPQEEKVESSSASHAPPPSTQSLNLSGIDLDNFFDVKATATSGVPSSYQETSKKGETLSKEAHASFDSGGLDDFDSLSYLKTATSSSNTKGDNVDNSFADWGANFQSASSMNTSSVFSMDLFDDPSKSGGPKMQIDGDAGFNSQLWQSNTTYDKPYGNDMGHISATEERIQEDVWQSADVKVPSSADQQNTGTSSSVNKDLLQGGKTEVSTSVQKVDDGPLDVWQDFTSSQGASNVLPNSWPVNDVKGTSLKASDEKNLNDVLDDMEFGDFLQSDSLSATMSVQGDLPNLNGRQFEAELADSLNSAGAEASIQSNVTLTGTKSEGASLTGAPQQDLSSQSSVEVLLSQMHDLSFMLESNLCLPKTTPS